MSETKACVKCGLVDGPTASWYSQTGSLMAPRSSASRRYCRRDGVKGDCKVWTTSEAESVAVAGEHLDVTCAGCGYVYAEPCKDAKP